MNKKPVTSFHKAAPLLALLACFLFLMHTTTGCSSKHTTTTTEITEKPHYGDEYSSSRRVTTTQTVTKEDEFCDGVFSCTFSTLGVIIAFPFKVVAKTVEFVLS